MQAITSKKASHYRVLQNIRYSEIHALTIAGLQRLRMGMMQSPKLPKVAEHFRKHGEDFDDLGVTAPEQLNDLLNRHIQRPDLRTFTYISTQKGTQYRHWLLVNMDNGVIVLYNETKRVFWSMFRKFRDSGELEDYLNAGMGWWVEVIDWQEVQKW